MTPDGAVLAMVGGRDYARSQFNRAAQARRQPGSLFKLFVYLAALQSGMSPDSPVTDAPIKIGDWEPGNFGDRYRGRTTLRAAFTESLNSVAVRLAEEVGRDKVIALARSMGIESPLAPDPSLALVTSEVTLLEITAAFAAVDAGVVRVQPSGVLRIVDPGAAFHAREAVRPAPPAWPRDEILDLLGAVVRSGTGKAAALDVPTFGKTGTTQESRDAWFVGFTRDLVVGMWVGNDDNAPMEGMTGGRLPARIWADFVKAARQGPRLAQAAVPTPPTPEPTPAPAPQPAPLPQIVRPPAPTVERPEPLVGPPMVVDTGALRIGGRIVRLEGVQGEGGRFAREMALYIGAREVTCEPTGPERYRCEVDGRDLSEAVLFNGGGRAVNRRGPMTPRRLRPDRLPLDPLQAPEAARASGGQRLTATNRHSIGIRSDVRQEAVQDERLTGLAPDRMQRHRQPQSGQVAEHHPLRRAHQQARVHQRHPQTGGNQRQRGEHVDSLVPDVGNEAEISTAFQEARTEIRVDVAVQCNPRHLAHAGGGQGWPHGERMILGKRHHEGIVTEQADAQVVGGRRRVREGNVQGAPPQRLQLRGGAHRIQADGGAGSDAAETAKRVDQQPALQRRLHVANRQRRLFPVRHPACTLLHSVGMRQQPARLRQEAPPLLGETQTLLGPFEQRQSQFGFQTLDLAAERRLRDVQALGRAADMLLLRGYDEGAQKLKIHGATPE
ncbi:MAG TPA: penicillin-binding transpeptidase domain-containing protein [Azospirillum sp.]|nr:penicillin-binding transpeptidase domain-containing protein [Azospirillum sp.]HYD68377.1 penicillin-binding transpeptidase domain-containing protein [Azospirillum sp.]